MSAFDINDLALIGPELIVGVGILLLLIGDLAFSKIKAKRATLVLITLLILAWAGVHLLQPFLGNVSAAQAENLNFLQVVTSAFAHQIAVDPLATFFRLFFVVIAMAVTWTSFLSKEIISKHMGEYLALLLSITLGMFLMASANDLLMVYLGVEFVSIVSFALAGYRQHDRRSSEAALKYVIYGGTASGVMLFGISLLYGMFGTTELTEIHHALVAWQSDPGQATLGVFGLLSSFKWLSFTLLVASLFVFAGFFYKIAAVPFHMWSPDVYEGAPTPFTGFLSVGPKAAGFALLIRFFIALFVPTGERGFLVQNEVFPVAIDLPLPVIMGIVAATTMTLGNLAAIWQNNVKRLLAYSSIAHAGYLLMGFVVLSPAAMEAVMFYLVMYFFMNLGAFTVCQAVRDKTGKETLDAFQGLGTRAPFLAIAMVVFLVALTGLPPTAGFIAKFYVFAAVVAHGGYWYWVLAVIAIINSAISLYYYMRIAKAMYFDKVEIKEPMPMGFGYTAVVALLTIPVLVFGLLWSPVMRPVRSSLMLYRSPVNAEMPIAKEDISKTQGIVEGTSLTEN